MKTKTKVIYSIIALGASYIIYRTLLGRMTSIKGLEFLKSLEGFKTKAYKDVNNLWTIGVGHLILPTENILLTKTLTSKEVNNLLDKDLDRFERVVSDSIKVPLTQHKKDALVSLAFNIGESGFKNSSLVKRINSNASDESIIKAFSMWNKPAVLAGRRAKEARLYLTGNYSNSITPIELSKYFRL
jgi:lysozyme